MNENKELQGEQVGPDKVATQNPGIPEIRHIPMGQRCTLAVPVKLPHSAGTMGEKCNHCGIILTDENHKKACPDRPMIVGHYHKVFKVHRILDKGQTVVLKRIS